jgi:hypothetical protein
MTQGRLITAVGLIALLAAPALADAQSRNRGGDRGGNRQGATTGRAVPRGPVSRGNGGYRGPSRAGRPQVVVPRSYASRGYANRGYVNRGYANRGYVYRGYNRGYGGFAYGYRTYGYPGYYRPSLGLNLYFGNPGYYGRPYGYAYPGYGYPGYAYPAYGAPGYVAIQAYGGLRIDLPVRDAEVYVDGYYVGIVDDFDGTFQQANLEPGPHRIEVNADGFEPIVFDVNILPNRTTTYRAGMVPLQP